MKAMVYSPYGKSSIIRTLQKNGLVVTDKCPDFVFVYGGDGSILNAEHLYPSVPKVPIRKSIICSKCRHYSAGSLAGIIDAIKAGDFTLKEERKVDLVIGGKVVSALNEVQIRNSDLRKSLRFRLSWNGQKKEVIGDGIVAATPYGSTAYYRSLGYEPFSSGICIGFNNVWPKMKPLKAGKCAVRIIREKAVAAADNFFVKPLKEGDSVIIRESRNVANFVVIS